MSAFLAIAFGEYIQFYRTFFVQQWNHMTPGKFCFLLIAVAAAGFLMMKSGTRSI